MVDQKRKSLHSDGASVTTHCRRTKCSGPLHRVKAAAVPTVLRTVVLDGSFRPPQEPAKETLVRCCDRLFDQFVLSMEPGYSSRFSCSEILRFRSAMSAFNFIISDSSDVI